MIPNIVFFARDYQAEFFPKLKSEKYFSIYVTMTIYEKRYLEKQGHKVSACFEEEFELLESAEIEESYFLTSLVTDRFLGKFSLEERRHLLSKEITFWVRIFDKYKPVAVVNEIIAIEIAEVMYIEALKRKIRYFAWMVSPFEQRNFYWLDEPYHARLKDEIFERIPDQNSIEFATKYFQSFNVNENTKPFYASNLSSRYNIIKLLKHLFSLTINITRSFNYSTKNKFLESFYVDKADLFLRIRNYFNSFFWSYDKTSNKFDLVFYPLHYEPEASILYMSEYYENQIGLIRNLSKCLTNNQLLVVKEHPQQPGMLLSRAYRKLKKQTSNVIFLPAEFSTKNLINQSKFVLTQTSTAGWEAIILGKPVVVFGKVFYDNHPGVNKFLSFDILKTIIHKHQLKHPQKEDTIKYIAQMWDYCNMGNPYPNPELYKIENIAKIIHAIEQKI